MTISCGGVLCSVAAADVLPSCGLMELTTAVLRALVPPCRRLSCRDLSELVLLCVSRVSLCSRDGDSDGVGAGRAVGGGADDGVASVETVLGFNGWPLDCAAFPPPPRARQSVAEVAAEVHVDAAAVQTAVHALFERVSSEASNLDAMFVVVCAVAADWLRCSVQGSAVGASAMSACASNLAQRYVA